MCGLESVSEEDIFELKKKTKKNVAETRRRLKLTVFESGWVYGRRKPFPGLVLQVFLLALW